MTLAVAPGAVLVGANFSVDVVVRNSGAMPASNVLPALQINAGGTLTTPLGGPVPAGPVALAAGASQAFRWNYTAAAAGTVTFTGTGTGWDAAFATTITGSASAAVPILTRLCPSSGHVISTLAGTGTAGYNGDGIAATAAQIRDPYGMMYDAAGNLFVADPIGSRIRRVDAVTGLITTVAGTGVNGFNGDGGAATTAQLSNPIDVAVDGAGNVYIADDNNHRIRKVAAASGLISTVAGTGVSGYNGDGIQATSAQLNFADGVAVDGAGNVYSGDRANRRIRKVTAATGLISTVAGTGVSGYNGDGIQATSANLNYPNSIALDAVGNLYIGDYTAQRIRKVTIATGVISTIAGTGVGGYNGDGIAATAATVNGVDYPRLDPSGNMYFGDTVNNRTRRVDALSGIITTVAGTGTAGYNGDGIAGTAARVNSPAGVAVSSSCRVAVGDTNNHRVRLLTPPSLLAALTAAPNPATAGQSSILVLTVTNTGDGDVTNLRPALDVNAGAALPAGLSGPVPATVPTLAPGAAAGFTWTYQAASAGTV
ncbi:MAG: hypothetical protein AAB368_11240, partial [bacterium]